MSRWWFAVVVVVAGCPGSGPKPPARTPAPAPWQRPTPPELPALEAGALTWDAGGAAELDASGPLVVDGDRVVWASSDGGVRAAPAAGGPATVLAHFEDVAALAAAHDRIYILGDDALWAVARDGTLTGLATLWGPTALAVTDDAVYVADGDWIRAVPLDGGEPTTLATEAGEPSAIAADATHVYWTDGGYPAPDNVRRGCVEEVHTPGVQPAPHPHGGCSNDQRYGAIERVPVGGGKVQARAGFYPSAIAVLDDHVYWADTDGEAATRARLDGNGLEVVLGGRGDELAVDATSTVVRTMQGLLVEVPAAGGAPWVVDGTSYDGGLAITADTIYTSGAGMGLRRYPRGPTRTTVLAVPSGKIEDAAVSGDSVYYVDAHTDDRDDAVMRVPRAGGAPALVRTHAGDAIGVRVSGDHVVTFDGTAMALDAGGAPLATELSPDAIAIDDRAIYWLQDLYVRAQPFAGGPVETYYQPPAEAFEVAYGSSGGKPPASLSVHDDIIVASSQALSSVIRIDNRPRKPIKGKPAPPKVEVFADGKASNGAAAGDKVVAWTEDGLTVYPGGKLILPIGDGGWPDAIVADARDAFLLRDGWIVRVPLDGGAPEALLNVLDGTLALTDDALYVAYRYGDALLRIAR